ncbi:hypothetical protein BEWA_018990 [Theileria equi strain WA]|uniref:SPX domain-containing protein n=1 Tax=Theileria equi strain WA TaxID=1537102 RepID=L0AVY0_THEEQ|nr:hypothetical protein BEWA_018990 [Theileria equi strain WA]AFZ79054.1 hypothetical protein BEWA_018990 [Theileria equi strain WA]|eukprot:XP_004828720.1 hypothetical protein BEWA_018990 [Theileria equi strain WA]
MKFGSKLESFLVKEWADKYVRYKYLNRLIKGAKKFEVENKNKDEGTILESSLFPGDSVGDPKDVKFDTPQYYSDHVSVEISPENEGEENKTLPNDASSFQYHYVDDEDNSDKILNVIKLMASQFEEYGHLSFCEVSVKDRLDSHSKLSSVTKRKNTLGDIIDKLESESVIGISSDVSFSDKGVKFPRVKAKIPQRAHKSFRLSRHPKKKKSVYKSSVKLGSTKLKIFGNIPLPFRRQKETTSEYLSLFNKSLRDDIRTVILHYTSEMEYIQTLIKYLRRDIRRRQGKIDNSYVKLVQKAATALWDSCDKLQSYLNVNILAVYKLLKKKDKLLGTNDLTNVYPSYKGVLLSVDNCKETNDKILALFDMVSPPSNVDFIKLKEGVETSLSVNKGNYYYLSYVLGLSTMLLLACVFLCSFFFVCSLIWWGCGWCQNYLEIYGVNYQFMFGLSNNYSISDKDFYFFGALQSLLCLALFCFLLLDCKLLIVGSHSRHFSYPITLITFSILVMLLPNKNFKLKLRKKLLLSCGRLFTSSFGIGAPVTLVDSILADILTSLTRPLSDFLYIFSYFSYGISHDSHRMHDGKSMLSQYVIPQPYQGGSYLWWISERRKLHVGNMLKYISAMSCIVISSINWTYVADLSSSTSNAIVVTFYTFATLFNFLWDYFIDWGLSLPPNILKGRNGRIMYTRKAYYIACVINLSCRCTWALTTSPLQLISNKELSSNLLVLIVSVIEIFRRIVWVAFRLESEHLLNSYKYRTALWIPKLYNCKSVLVNELTMLNQ